MSTPSSAPDISRLKIDRSRPRQRPRFGRWILLIVFVVGGYFAWRERGRVTSLIASPIQARVRSANVLEQNLDLVKGDGTSANGYVVARSRAALSTIIPGQLVEINVEEGSRVEAGQVVARIQFDDYETAVESARRDAEVILAERDVALAAVDSSLRTLEEQQQAAEVQKRLVAETQVELDSARRELERQRESAREGDISESEWDRFETLVQSARARLETTQAREILTNSQVKTAEKLVAERQRAVSRIEASHLRAMAALKAAELNLEKTFVRAPFAGTIITKSAERGEVVAATGAGGNSRGAVATLVDMATLEIQVELPEARLGIIKENTPARIFLDIEPRVGYSGRVRQVWPTADRQKGTIEIRVVFEERPVNLRPELGARVVFTESRESRPATAPTTVLTVPSNAVRDAASNPWVYLVNGGRVERRNIKLGEKLSATWIVKDGLRAQDRVVIEGHESLKPGDLIPEE